VRDGIVPFYFFPAVSFVGHGALFPLPSTRDTPGFLPTPNCLRPRFVSGSLDFGAAFSLSVPGLFRFCRF